MKTPWLILPIWLLVYVVYRGACVAIYEFLRMGYETFGRLKGRKRCKQSGRYLCVSWEFIVFAGALSTGYSTESTLDSLSCAETMLRGRRSAIGKVYFWSR
jgi:hypothetical protein